ncbi:uncharacterized protein N7498_008582 [Penicillium cinerascens]|uniref:Pheromone n=1 Tax=Penicillium cinerascens TaxID=70096 RepID=A0A9W9MAY2_9EURO|nr:uncharacterized protein N7498_008582 [Penicillium cinerascens]KAJ5195144.1 hypothetical protein N7498_008582 [Penicillium cinerascens]
MKYLSIAIPLLAAATVQAAAVPEAQNEPGMPIWCGHPGQGCYMYKRTAGVSNEVKRSAEALAEAMAEAHPQALQIWCGHPGQGCAKAKRAAEAADEVKRSADALAYAMAALDEE